MNHSSQNLKENKTSVSSNTNTSNSNTKTDNKNYKGKRNFFKNKNFFFVKKKCFFTKNKIAYIDFRDIDLLRRFLKKSGQIISNRITGVTNINQRKLAKAVKRARFMGLLPFSGILPSNKPFTKNFSSDYRKNRIAEKDSATSNQEKKENNNSALSNEKSEKEKIVKEENNG